MLIGTPIQLNLDNTPDINNKFEDIQFVVNKVNNDYYKALNNLTISENFNAYIGENTVTVDEDIVFRHSLGRIPDVWFVYGDGRVQRTKLISKGTNILKLKVILDSTNLTDNASDAATIAVANPYIFEAGDTILVGTIERVVTSITTSAREVVVSTTVSGVANDLVRLKSDRIKIFIA